MVMDALIVLVALFGGFTVGTSIGFDRGYYKGWTENDSDRFIREYKRMKKGV